MRATDIAVVGVACRFPEAATPARFWQNIDAGVVSARELPAEVFRSAGVPDELLDAPDFVRVAATLPDPAGFAAEFFGYPPREAELIDPAQRLFLEACWEALEWAGHPPRADGPLTGVFAGTGPSRYPLALQAAMASTHGVAAVDDDADLYLGSGADFLTSRVAYKLGLRGPSVTVQTACSSGLTAVHYAVLSLLANECEIALAGAATVLEPVTGYRYQPGGLTSRDGLCRAFDAASTGTSFSSGVGVVVLRRLADALADGDPVLAVVRGTAVGNDGADRPGFTAPSPAGLAAVVATALRVADAPAADLRYVEAHGSGTALGDQIELRGLIDGLAASPGSPGSPGGSAGTAARGYCGLGSVKANIGHCGPSAGIAGFVKAVHVAHTGTLPPHPLFEVPRNPGVLAESPFFISARPGNCPDPQRLVLVNSMGLGGTIASAVLAPPPAPTRRPARSPAAGEPVRLVLSARSRGELDALSRALADELDRGALPIADVAHTLRVGRRSFAERRVVTAPPEQLAAALRLPRPPATRTTRAEHPRSAVVSLAADAAVPGEHVGRLAAALRAGEPVRGPVEGAGADAFVVLVGHGEPGPGRYLLAAGAGAEHVDEAVAAAWLHGVDVDWEALASDGGRRVPLPTYPFRRGRFWALDRLDPVAAPAARATPVATAAVGPADGTDRADRADGAGGLEADLLSIWRRLFGIDTIGVDDEFGALGGTSLLSVRMALEIQQRHDVLVNLHRAGGSKATVRRLAEIVRGWRRDGPVADGDGRLVDADIELPLGRIGPARPAPGGDVLLTGGTGFLGAFLLHELQRRDPSRRVYCLVRAADERDGRARLADAAARYRLPPPDPGVVHVVPGDLREVGAVCRRHHGGELAGRVGHVLHCAARVVFTEPYRVLRADNTLPTVELLRWARASGVPDFGFVSSVAATGEALGGGHRIVETREQPLDPRQGGYGVGKWVCERVLERAEKEGLRVRVFRPGFIVGATETGACNAKDWIWHLLAGGLAVGAHPLDDRALPVAPVDVVARAVVELTDSPGAAGRAFHLVDEVAPGPRRLFELLADAGLPTRPVETGKWQRMVADEALRTGSRVLSNVALYELEGHHYGERDLQAQAWRPWLEGNDLSAAVTGELLRRCLTFLAEREPGFAGLATALREPHPVEAR